MNVLEKFESKVDRSGDCHLWTGCTNKAGYGQIKIKGKQFGTHVVAAKIKFGMFDERVLVRHSCNVKACCNPDHLLLGTEKDNHDDAVRDGLMPWQKQTHCKNGHPFSGDNLYFVNGKHRRCRTCSRERQRVQNAKR